MTHLTPEELLAKLREDYEVTGCSGSKWMQSQLAAAFDLVAPKPNWKMPINAKLHRIDCDETLLSDAVIHFTGSVPTITRRGGWRHVKAAGYYRTIGA